MPAGPPNCGGCGRVGPGRAKWRKGRAPCCPPRFSPDGRRLAYGHESSGTRADPWTRPPIFTIRTTRNRSRRSCFRGLPPPNSSPRPYQPADGSCSSQEAGPFAVYQRPFPGAGRTMADFRGRRLRPLWSRTGRQICFRHVRGPHHEARLAGQEGVAADFVVGRSCGIPRIGRRRAPGGLRTRSNSDERSLVVRCKL